MVQAPTEEAFAEFGTMALWNMRDLEAPGPDDALWMVRRLRITGDLDARRLASEAIERTCCAVN